VQREGATKIRALPEAPSTEAKAIGLRPRSVAIASCAVAIRPRARRSQGVSRSRENVVGRLNTARTRISTCVGTSHENDRRLGFDGPPRSPLAASGTWSLETVQSLRFKATEPVTRRPVGPVLTDTLVSKSGPLLANMIAESSLRAENVMKRMGSGEPIPGIWQTTVRSTMREAAGSEGEAMLAALGALRPSATRTVATPRGRINVTEV
jgi:hypothetical protein